MELDEKAKYSTVNYGIIIHYGLYSYYAYDDVRGAKQRKTQNGAEWYYGRLIEKNNFRPISGHNATKKHHATTYGNASYFDEIDKIITDPSKVIEWVKIAKTKGASYIILTSKHHDGICLFDTATASRKSKLDICKVFADECRRQNIDFGFYYSWFEFDKSFTIKYFNNYCVPQLTELMNYSPKYMWFDGQWKVENNLTIQKMIGNIVKNMKLKNVIVNDRIGNLNIDLANYRVYTDRYIPLEPNTSVKWQHINTIGYSWGYNRQQLPHDYKTHYDMRSLYKEIIRLGGDFLINVGPDENGDIIREELSALDFASNV